MTARAARRPISRRARIVIWIGVAWLCAILLGSAIYGAVRGTSTQQSSVDHLGAEMQIDQQNLARDVADGDAQRAQSDREALLGVCNTAQEITLGTDQTSAAIRTTCASLGDPVP